jgi:hypothetical protein
MSVGRDILATQFHAELTPALVERWSDIPQYLEWLDAALGPNAYERVRAEALPLMPGMESMSRAMFDNLIANHAALSAAA